jgi:translocation and assembly module TamB
MLTFRRILLALLAVAVLALALLWFGRKPLAEGVLERALAGRGVQASYVVKSIGLRWERIEKVRIGDPRNPDLTAEWIEIRVGGGLRNLSATAIRAGGVRLRGRLVDGRVSLGSVDKLLPKGDEKTPFALPDLDVDLSDARMRLDTPYGAVGAKLDGKGNLAGGFAGKLAAIAPVFGTSDCTISRATAYVDVTIKDRAPIIAGPVRAGSARCNGVVLAEPAIALDAVLGPSLDRWRGTARVEAKGLQASGATLAEVSGRFGFNGTANDTTGTADLSANAARYGMTRLSGLAVNGGFRTGGGLRGDGAVRVDRLMPDPALAGRVAGAARSAGSTPLGPLLAQLARATRTLSQAGFAVTSDVRFGDGTATVSRIIATGADRMVLRVEGGEGIRFGSGQFLADTQVRLSGGGLPMIESTFQRRADGMTLGLARIAPLASGGSRLALAPVRFAAKPSGAMLFETVATLDGPLGDGRVDGLRLPVALDVAANGAITLNRGCAPLAFQRLAISGLTLQPAALRLCPADGGALFALGNGQMRGGATIAAPRLAGRIGSTPVALAANGARLSFGSNGFTVDRLAVRLGPTNRLSQLDIGSLTGRISGSTVQGKFTGTTGKIANVPLLIGQSAGDWTLRNGALMLTGGVTVSDEQVPGRFNPLASKNVLLKLVDGQIAVTGTLQEPNTGTDVTKVVIVHNLRSGTGNATLDVASLRFGKALQPEMLTNLTIGVIANVEGIVSGRGDIRWTANGITSSGRFGTQGMDFAAAFGPVTGLKGDIVFNDLLALATPPNQQVTLATVNPGTLVTDGSIRYQLLAGQKIAIEGGDWPFAGGNLTLDPTIIDMGQASERRLTFRVVALDAAKFIEHLEFENLSATGTFDGVMPMIFDASGGRIEEGRLVVRESGGTLAYVGEISNTKMNVFANLAFDALKSIKYKNLTIDLNGPLDGEIISKVNFNGINENPLSPPKGFIARQFTGLPFVFNITIKAPFRSLLNTARTFQDPSSLIQQVLPRDSKPQKPPVQPSESESKR